MTMNDKLNAKATSNAGLTMMGFALGAAVGAGLALLMAPDSGKNTRKNLASTARRWSKGAGHAIDQARDAVADLGDDAKSTARRWSKGAGHAIEQARDAVADLGNDAKSAIEAGKDSFQHDRAARVTPGHNAAKREEIAR
jgi:gas vesicle protein